MGSFWGPVTKANLERVGPFTDAVAGTDGEDTDVNALVTAGNNRIILGPGSILTAALTLSAAGGGYLWSPAHPEAINLGAWPITVTGSGWHLEGFEINGSASVGILITTGAGPISIARVSSTGNTTHGIQGNGTVNDVSITDCKLFSNTVDGLKIGASHNAWRVVGNFIWDNGGWGINDLSDSVIEGSNRLDSNSSGAISGTSPNTDGASKLT